MTISVYIGFDPREQDAYDVCAHSLRRHASIDVLPRPIRLDELRRDGLYRRPTEIRDGRLWDVISEAPMSTEFAISRFFVPLLAARNADEGQWAIFCDCDFLWLNDVATLLQECDPDKALCCVQHSYEASESLKMDGQVQLNYQRKNWSSLMIFNLRHPRNEGLTVELLNFVPGRDLHRFCWLGEEDIGAVSFRWNWLEGTYKKDGQLPHAIHFTRGGPWMENWTHVDFGDLWSQELESLKLT